MLSIAKVYQYLQTAFAGGNKFYACGLSADQNHGQHCFPENDEMVLI
jgi:hypothetical protein